MTKQITASWLERTRLNPGEVQWRADPLCPGLLGRVSMSKSGRRSMGWYFRHKPKAPFAIEQYPALAHEDARRIVDTEIRQIAKELVGTGRDVKEKCLRRRARQVAQEDAEEARTIRALIPEYLDFCKRDGLAEGTIKLYRRGLRPLAHWWGAREPSKITRGAVQDLSYRVQDEGVPPFDIDGSVLKRVSHGGGHRAAGHTLSAGRAFWTFLLDRELAESNPFAMQKKLAKRGASGTSDAVLETDEEIRAVLASDALDQKDKTILRMMLATGLRPGEVCGAQWSEIDLEEGVWEIPKGRMKYKSSGHTVFMSDYLIEHLRASRASQRGRPRYVFPAKGSHVDPTNLGERFRRLGLEKFTPKVCRSTFRTGMTDPAEAGDIPAEAVKCISRGALATHICADRIHWLWPSPGARSAQPPDSGRPVRPGEPALSTSGLPRRAICYSRM